MVLEDDLSNILLNICEDIDGFSTVNLSDNIVTLKLNNINEAYDVILNMNKPNFYYFGKVYDNNTSWYKLRYEVN